MKQEITTEAELVAAIDDWGETAEYQPDEPDRPHLMVADIPSIFSFTDSAMDWGVEGVFPMAAITLLSGDPGVLKTTMITSAGRCMADGTHFCGLKTTPRPVLILDKENSLPVKREMLERLGIRDGNGLTIWGGWNLDEPPALGSVVLHEFVAASNPKPFIAVDSLIANLDGDENSSTDVRRFFSFARPLVNMGAGIGLLHHSGKAESSKDYRGSSDIKSGVDVAYRIEPIGDPTRLSGIRLVAFKARFSVQPTITLRWDGCRFEQDGAVFNQPKSVNERLRDLLIENPGITTAEFCSLAASRGLGRDRARAFLIDCKKSRTVDIVTGANNAKFHYWIGSTEAYLGE